MKTYSISRPQVAFLGALDRQGGQSKPHAHTYPNPYIDELGGRHHFTTVGACIDKGWIRQERTHRGLGEKIETVILLHLTDEGLAVLGDLLECLVPPSVKRLVEEARAQCKEVR